MLSSACLLEGILVRSVCLTHDLEWNLKVGPKKSSLRSHLCRLKANKFAEYAEILTVFKAAFLKNPKIKTLKCLEIRLTI